MKNIRWELYKKAHDIKNDEDVKGSDYIIWITTKLRDYTRIHELDLIKGYFSAKQNAEFDEWLRWNHENR